MQPRDAGFDDDGVRQGLRKPGSHVRTRLKCLGFEYDLYRYVFSYLNRIAFSAKLFDPPGLSQSRLLLRIDAGPSSKARTSRS